MRIFFLHVFVFLMQNTTIIIRAPVVVKCNYVEMRIRRYLCKSGPWSCDNLISTIFWQLYILSICTPWSLSSFRVDLSFYFYFKFDSVVDNTRARVPHFQRKYWINLFLSSLGSFFFYLGFAYKRNTILIIRCNLIAY